MTDFLDWRMRIRPLFRQTASILFPPRCPLCDGLLPPGENVHAHCARKLPVITGNVCLKCGKAVHGSRVEYCDDCLRNRHVFDNGRALFLYQGVMKECMYRFKYANRREYAVWFAKEAVKRKGDWLMQQEPQLIIPIPMYRKKQQQRGYNQALVFARALSDETGIPFSRNFVQRIHDTKPMKFLNNIERKNNLKNAFQAAENIVKYKKVLLVDDIYTTGYTMDEVARELRIAGVDHISFLCVCIGRGN